MSTPASLLLPTDTQDSITANAKALNMQRVAAIVLGGGQGTRLFPLTQSRCKPAISFGGVYCLVDVALSNAIHSGCRQIFVITQFLSSSLHKHICSTYQSSSIFQNGFIDLLPAEQRPTPTQWFQGTADAVRQNLDYLKEAAADYFLILSGDQLYNFDFREMLKMALETDADAIIAAMPVQEQEAKRMGLLRVNQNGGIIDFYEKPQEADLLKRFRCDPPRREKGKSRNPFYLGSMGIYLFKRSVLIDLLLRDRRDDFGKHLLPSLIQQGNVFAYAYQGYWEDIGTIRSFYEANLALTQPTPPFHLHDVERPIFSSAMRLAPPKILDTQISHAILCDGTLCEAMEISNSIVGPRSVIRKGTTIRSSYLMGNNFYKPPVKESGQPSSYEIGEDCFLERCIIDKHVFIGKGVQLTNRAGLEHYDGEGIYIRDGIIIVSRGAVVPDGFCL